MVSVTWNSVNTFAGILVTYFMFLWIQGVNVFAIYGELMYAVYSSHTLVEFVPILFGIVKGF
jgi:hypothetical protein